MSKEIWRLLDPGEITIAGDMFQARDLRWRQVEGIGQMVGADTIRRRESHPTWPAPRDARTDPPKKEDGNSCGDVLGIIKGYTDWTTWKWHQARLALWLPLPPAPVLKSEAEQAWDKVANELTAVERVPKWSRESFIAGYEAAKGAK